MQASSQVANEEVGVGANALDGPIVNDNDNTTEINTSLSGNTTLGSRSLMPNAELLTRLRSMSLSGVEAQTQPNILYQPPESTNQVQTRGRTSNSAANVQHGVTNNNIYAAATMTYMAANPYYQTYHAYTPQQYALGAYAVNPTMTQVTGNYPSYNSTVTTNMNTRTPASESTNRMDLQAPHPSTLEGAPLYPVQNPMSYLQWYYVNEARNALNRGDGRGGNSLETHKEYVGSLHYGAQLGYRSPSSASAYYASPNVGFLIPYGNSSISSPVIPGLPMAANAFSFRHPIFHIPSGFGKSIAGNSYVGQTSDSGQTLRASSLLEELKNNKTRKFELADIVGHMVEFSCNQHGSRFIQQKLETVSFEEKAMVIQEVIPHALILMKDVFGNYVIQKLFECGSLTQKMELVQQISGHVLNLSLDMYGCRVIQKALEAVDAEHQFRLISELDGHVMQCVENQNGNHVIQKCIECVPPEHTKFILSAFHGQVVRLSTHLYGCRVIQRVLERCTDEQKGDIMQEILQAFSSLAEDKYGNYVVQHVVEHGKPEERSEIIGKMVGQIVRMSQHKFASNVVEKCLKFGCPEERQILITEILGQTDQNEHLQVMMKDQYANYVVQKVLEICDDQQREVLLSCIRVHLHSLKKYTYGKHIVACVEKLVASGEHHDASTILSM